VKDWLWNGEGMDRHLHFQPLSSLLTLGKKKFFFFTVLSFLVGELYSIHTVYNVYRMSRIVSTIGWKIHASEVRTCYRTSIMEDFFWIINFFTIKYHHFSWY
jgi:hypothetical protein